MKEILKKYKLWVNLAIYLAAVLLAFFFAVRPLIAKIRFNSDEIQKKIIDGEISQARIAKLPEMRDNYAIFSREKDNLRVILDQENSVDFIKKLESLAEETGNKIALKIEENIPDPKAKKDDKSAKKDAEDIRVNLPTDKYLMVEISLEGKYENFINFLYKLENLDYYVNIVSVSLKKEALENNRENQNNSPSFGVMPSNSPNNLPKIISEDILKSTINAVVYTK